jgi:AcrR family transcriptional regulator
MLKEEKIRTKKAHITQTLMKLLSERVYSQISIEDVAESAGLSKGGLRHYFSTKEELYTELIESFFSQIQEGNAGVIDELEFDISDKAFMSTLLGVEKFLVDKKNIRVFINIILYGFEDEKIMKIITKFLRTHLEIYSDIIKELAKSTNNSDADDAIFKARISQLILFFAGLFEFIDPIEMKTSKLVEYILKIIKGFPEQTVISEDSK